MIHKRIKKQCKCKKKHNYNFIMLCLGILAAVSLFLAAPGICKAECTNNVTHVNISGTITEGIPTESDIISGEQTIIITLEENQWATDVDSFPGKRELFFNSLVANSETAEWAKVVDALKTAGLSAISRSSDTEVVITLPATNSYNIISNQTISILVPPDLLLDSSQPVTSPVSFTINADQAAIISGTVTAPTSESDIVVGGATIIISLTNNTWVEDVATNATRRDSLFDGLAALGTEGNQWNNVVSALKSVPDPELVINRTSDSVVTITLPAMPDYNIIVDQSIKITIPADLLQAPGVNLEVNPAFTISSIMPTIAITGTVIPSVPEQNIYTGGKTIIITLNRDSWVSDLATNAVRREALFDGLTAGTETTQWDKVISQLKAKALIDPAMVIVRNSDTVVTITLPATGDYNINANQTISLTIPVSVLLSASSPVTASPSFTVLASPEPTATISGTVITAPATEADIVNGGKSIIITLNGGAWDPNVTTNTTLRENLLNELKAVTESTTWTNKVISTLKASSLTDPSLVTLNGNIITITLPASAGYNTTAEQTVRLTIPKALIIGASADVVASPEFKITPVNPVASITGTIIEASERDIYNGGSVISIKLTDDTWATDVVSNTTKRNALIGGLSANSEQTEWTKVTTLLKASSSAIVLKSPTLVTITLPEVLNYNIRNDQSITLKIPKTVLTLASADVTAAPELIIKQTSATACIFGTIKEGIITGKDIVDGNKTIIINLNGNQWVADVASNELKRNLLFNNLIAGDQEAEWGKVVLALKTAGSSAISLASNNRVVITLPPVTQYQITANQTIRVNIPTSLLLNTTNPVTALADIAISADRAAAITGTIMTPTTESDIAAGNRSIIITLTNDTWISDLITKPDLIINGLTAESEAAAWNEVVDTMNTMMLTSPQTYMTVNPDNKQLTITLAPIPDYDIIKSQTITLNVPTDALASGLPLEAAAPIFTINPVTTATAVLSGTAITAAPTETDIKTGNKTVSITLIGNQWATDIASLEGKRNLLFDNLLANSESSAWAKLVAEMKRKGTGSITRNSNNKITITLPPESDYTIRNNQTINVCIPPSLLLDSNTQVASTYSFNIIADQAAAVSGTIISPTTEYNIIAGGKTIIISLTNNTWVTDVISNTTKRDSLLDGLNVVGGGEADPWNSLMKVIKSKYDPFELMNRTSDQVVTITLPAMSDYNIFNIQNVKLTIPAELLVSPGADLVVDSAFTITPESSDKRCFIATAAYGSYLDPHVASLRDFRDRYLLRSAWGSAFVRFYYKHSPPLAAFISQHQLCRTATRIMLTPIVFAVINPVESGIILIIFCILLSTILFSRKMGSKC